MHWQLLEDDRAAGALAAALADLHLAAHLAVPHLAVHLAALRLIVHHPATAIPADHQALALAEAAPSLIHSLPLFSY